MSGIGTNVTTTVSADQALTDMANAILAGTLRFNTVRKNAHDEAGAAFDYAFYTQSSIATNDNAAIAGGFDAVYARLQAIYGNLGVDAGTTTTGAATDTQRDGFAYLQSVLTRYGIATPELLAWAWEQIVQGKPEEMILLELEERPEFQMAFPEIAAIRAENASGGFNRVPPTPAEIIEYRETGARLLANAGIGYLADNDLFTELIVGGVSASELSFRINEAFLQAKTGPEELRAAFADFFGVNGDAALAAHFLDPDRATSALQQELGAAALGGAATRFGFTLSAQAAIAAQERFGISTFDQAAQGIAQTFRLRPLLAETVSESEDLTFEDEGLDVAFGGPGEEDLRRRLEQRQAAFAGGGGALVGQTGIGLGAADG